MAKVVLFGNACYSGMSGVLFPALCEVARSCDNFAWVDGKELIKVGGSSNDFNLGQQYPFALGSECELIADTPTPSNPQTTDLAIHCNGIDEVSYSRIGGFKQMVTLTDACVEDVIENIGADRFFVAFDNEELAEHLRKYGYEVTKND